MLGPSLLSCCAQWPLGSHEEQRASLEFGFGNAEYPILNFRPKNKGEFCSGPQSLSVKSNVCVCVLVGLSFQGMILESFPWIHEERVVASVQGVCRPGLKFAAPALPGGELGEGRVIGGAGSQSLWSA